MGARHTIRRGPSGLASVLLALFSAACLEQPYRACDTGLVCQLDYECSPRGDFCVQLHGCGNGRIDPGEVCDYGDRVSGDGCSQDCTSDETCGNRVRDRWESCDDGNRAPEDGCSPVCQLEGCGNRKLDNPDEVCDDGNSVNGDGCSADCLSKEECGNGHLDIGLEGCDDGNTTSGDGCSDACIDEKCGNSVVDPGEHCDDGNTTSGDHCSADCKSDESCGNRIVDFSIGEHCDDGNTASGDGCQPDCRRSTCGDGISGPGEACDDGNITSGDGCNADCLNDEFCGNGAIDPGEMCDSGAGLRCNMDCTSDLTCSNRYHDTETERCDDGRSSPFCDFDCTRVTCGDGVRNDAAGETCDRETLHSLASLVVSGFAPAIELVPDKFDYVLDLPLSQSSATVTVTVAMPGAELTIAGTSVASGAPSAPLSLVLGDNVVDIVVKTPLGGQHTYYLTLRRADQLAQYAYGKASNTGAKQFGWSVALSGDTLAVGAHDEDSAALGVGGKQADAPASENSGAVYVFRRSGSAWLQEAYLEVSNPDAGDSFGYSVTLSDDTLAVGVPYEDSAALGVGGKQADGPALADSGAVYVFRRSGSAWLQEAYLKALNPDAGDSFGYSVALSGDTLAVGADGEDSAAQGVGGNKCDGSGSENSGTVYVFRRSGSTWLQEAYLKASNFDESDSFGQSVALLGDTLAVGAIYEDSAALGVGGDECDDSARDSGAVYVFHRSGSNWRQQAYLKASNTDLADYFGYSVALSGDTLAVGALNEDSAALGVGGDERDNSAPDSGAVYVFRRSGSTWRQQAYLKASNTDLADHFGYSVALSGDTLAVGAHDEDSAALGVGGNQDVDSASNSGAVYVFRRSGSTWLQPMYIKASNSEQEDAFGHSVALSGDTLAVGAHDEDSAALGVGGNQDDDSAPDSGAVYIFH